MPRINRSHPLAASLRDWWLMAPGDAGSSVLDMVRLSRSATASNAVQSGPAPGRASLAFPSSFSLASAPVFVSPLTVSCWCCPGTLSRGDLVTRWVNGGDGTPAADGDQYNLLYGSTSGKPQFYSAIGTLGTAMGTSVGSATMVVGRWHHVVGTHDGATASCYLDGVLQGTVSMTMNPSPSTALRLGDNLGGDGAYSGKLADVAIWSRCLTASDVAHLFAEAKSGYPDLLVRPRTQVSLLKAAIPPPPPSSGWLGTGYHEEDPMSITYGSWSTDSAINAVTVAPGTDQTGSSLSLDGKAVAHLSFEYAKSDADGKGGDIILEYLKDRDGTYFETQPGDLNKQVRRCTIPGDGSTGSTTITVYASEGKAIKPRVRVLGTSATVTLRTMTGTA